MADFDKEAPLVRNSESALSKALHNAVSVVEHSYLEHLDTLEIVKPSLEELDVDPVKCGKFYHLTHLVRDSGEHFLDKLITVVNAAFSLNATLVVLIRSDGKTTSCYLGILSKNHRTNSTQDVGFRRAAEEAFSGAVKGNFTGSRLEELDADSLQGLQAELFCPEKLRAVSAVSGIVALRGQENQDAQRYVQGIEKLTDALQGKSYSILTLADPVSSTEIQLARQGYEEIYTQLSIYAQAVLSQNNTETFTLSKAQTKGVTDGLTEGVNQTQSIGRNSMVNFGVNMGGNVGLSTGVNAVVKAGVHTGLSLGFNAGVSRGKFSSNSTGNSSSWSHQTSEQETDSEATASGMGKTVQITARNRSVQSIMDKIDQLLKRLDACASYGAFHCASYVLSETHADALSAASNYNALTRGEDSFLQASRINSWQAESYGSGERFSSLTRYLRACTHPRFYLDRAENHQVTPAALISGRELAIQFGLPKKSIRGLSVTEMAAFGREAPMPEWGGAELGTLYHMGRPENARLALDPDTLTAHVFIAGSTNSGKSNTVYQLLHQLCLKPNASVKFLVIEPAKGEYAKALGGYEGVSVYGTNPRKAPMLRLNPFAFPEDIHVLEHIDRLVEIFNACWPMYAAMPAVLKDAMEAVYLSCGWSLSQSVCRSGRFPTFETLLDVLPDIIDQSAYSRDTKSDYTGALVTRVKSLTNGVNGQIFCSAGKPVQLFDGNVIVDLSRVGSMETKALLMGILMIQLQERRMSEGIGPNASLRHVTVLEEAHNLLRRTSPEQSAESGNLQGKSVEMLANAIAEMRTYGEGFIIADQAPGLLDMAVIRNTNTKILLRLPEDSDRRLTGSAARLTEEQTAELSRLEQGIAAVFQNHWLEPVLCKVNEFTEKRPFSFVEPQETGDPEMNCLLERLVENGCQALPEELRASLPARIEGMALAGPVKKQLCRVLETPVDLTDGERENLLVQLLGGKTLLHQTGRNPDMAEARIMDLLTVSAELAAEIRKHLYSYAADYWTENAEEKHFYQKNGRD